MGKTRFQIKNDEFRTLPHSRQKLIILDYKLKCKKLINVLEEI